MGLRQLIDDLIREHGSASILKEHLEYLRARIEDMEADHKKEIDILHAVHAKAIAELNEKHRDEMAALEQQFAASKPTLETPDIDLIKEFVRNGGEMVLEHMPRDKQQRAKRLKDMGLLRDAGRIPGIATTYKLTPQAREYLSKSELPKHKA